MSGQLAEAAAALVPREGPVLAGATGLIFRALASDFASKRVESVIESHRGGAWGEDCPEGSGFPVLRSTNMRGQRADVSGCAWRDVPDGLARDCELRTGDILVSKSSGSSDLVGKSVLFVHPGSDQPYLFSNFLLRLRPSEEVVPEYLAWFLRSPQAFAWRSDAQQNAVGLRNLQTRVFLAQGLPVPDRILQQAAVDLLSAVEGGSEASVRPLPEPLQGLRPVIHSLEQLVAHLAQVDALMTSQRGAEQVLIQRIRALQLAEGEEVTLSDVLALCCGGVWGDFEDESGVGVLRSNAIDVAGRLALKDVRFRSVPARAVEKLTLSDGDLIMTKSNALQLVGNVAIFNDPSDSRTYVPSNFLQLLRVDREVANPKYVWHCLQTEGAKDYWRREASGSSPSLQNLNGRKIAAFRFRLPSLEAQTDLVARIDTVMAAATRRAALRSQSRAMTSTVLPSLLRRLFADNAVPDWEGLPVGTG